MPDADVPSPTDAPRGTPVRIPVACTLSAAAADARVDDWGRALRRTVIGVDRPTAGRLELRLREDPAAIAELIVLARAEKECCAFFEFSYEIEVDSIRLVVGVPPDAVGVLDGFAALAPPGSTGHPH